jgi:hypothetical protein
LIENTVNPLLDIDTNFYHYVSARSKAHALKSDTHLIGGKLDYAFDGDSEYKQKIGSMFGISKVFKPVYNFINENYRMMYGSSAKAGSLKFSGAYEATVKCAERLKMVLPVVCILASSEKKIYSLEGEGISEPCVVLTSGLAECGDDRLLKFLIGRELGKIQNGHCLYRQTASFYGLAGVDSDRRETLTDNNIKNALIEWCRLSDITDDRAGIISLDDPADYVKVALKSLTYGFTGIYPAEVLSETLINDSYEKIHFTPARSISLGSDVSSLMRRLYCGLEFINCEVLYNRRTDATPTVQHLVNKQAMEIRCAIISERGTRQ